MSYDKKVELYSFGLFYGSACAPAEMDGSEVADAVERRCPAGTSNGWHVCEEPTFSGGQPNPCPCDQHPETRRHWLLSC